MPGTVIRVEVKAGDKVEPRQTLLVLEAMKMETPVVSPYEAVVREVHVQEGDRVAGRDAARRAGRVAGQAEAGAAAAARGSARRCNADREHHRAGHHDERAESSPVGFERHVRDDREEHDEVDAADQEQLAHLGDRRRAHAAVAFHHRADPAHLRRDEGTPVANVIA